MRILFCNYEYPPLGGGGGVVNAALANELATRHDVTVLTSHGFDLPRDAVEHGVRVVRVPVRLRRNKSAASFVSMMSYIRNAPAVGRRLIGETGFDVINTHFALPTGPVGDALAKSSGIPNVLTVHGGDLYDPSKFTSPHRHWLLRRWVSRIVRHADAVIGQSTNTLENVRNFYAPDVDVELIPLGIDRPPDVDGDRAALGLGADKVLLVTVGRLVARKAVDKLIEVVARLGNPRVELLVVGSGPAQGELEAKAADLGVADQVRFLGFVAEDDKHRYLRASDLYVSTSRHEGFGLVFLEGMISGLPVICYGHGGQTDFLEDGRTGALVPLDDLEAFTAACRRYIDDPALAAAAGDENRRRVEQYMIDTCAKRYEAVFESVAQGAAAPQDGREPLDSR